LCEPHGAGTRDIDLLAAWNFDLYPFVRNAKEGENRGVTQSALNPAKTVSLRFGHRVWLVKGQNVAGEPPRKKEEPAAFTGRPSRRDTGIEAVRVNVAAVTRCALAPRTKTLFRNPILDYEMENFTNE